jgi:hypothetical protein
MKNVTITLEDRVARWARVEAAKAGKSLSRWIGDRLASDTGDVSGSIDVLERFLSGPGYPGLAAELPKRDELYH